MKISLFSSARDNRPRSWECSWQEFCEQLGPHQFVDTPKESLQAFSPAEYPEGFKRARENVWAVHLLAIDIDGRAEDEVLEFVDRAGGLAMLMYSTYSHGTKPGMHVRMVFPLSRPVPANEWAMFWDLASALFGNIGDPQCKDPSRIYFGPFAPKGTEENHFYESFEGEVIDVDALLDNPLEDLPPPPAIKNDPVTLEQLKAFADKLSKKKTNDKLSDLGKALLKVCVGEVFAEAGMRDNTIFELSLVIAKRFPDGDPTMLAGHFKPSLDLMGRMASDCPTVGNVEYKIQRAQAALRQERADRERDLFESRRARIREALGGGRTDPYSQEEIESFGPRPYWIIQKGRSYYFFVAGAYKGPYGDTEALNAALIELSPAPSSLVELWKINRMGDVTRKSCNELVAQYGTVAREVQADMRAQKTTYDPVHRRITEAPCPLRKLDAIYSPEIDEWLGLLAGEKYHDLKTWIATITLLDFPCVCIFITGPHGVGKTLFALGLSRLWSISGPTTMSEAFSDFNEALARCPLCFADETMPKDFRGYTKNSELREHVQATVRPYKRKHLPSAQLLGASRNIAAANNKNVLRTMENLTPDDIGAIIDRYLHFAAPIEAMEFLEKTNTYKLGWIEGDAIAQHALWLRDNHKWEREGRFLIRVRDEELTRSLATGGGDRSSVCQWLVAYLTNPTLFDGGTEGKLLVRVNKGRLCVNTQGVVDCWKFYVQNENCPPTGRISSAIAGLSLNGRAKLNNDMGVPTNYRVIDIANLIAWAANTGYATEEQIEAALKRDTESRAETDPRRMSN